MINIDSRLLAEIPKIGADAFAVLCIICNRINANNTAFPSMDLLQKETGFGRDKLTKAIKLLKQHNYISVSQINQNGRFAQNLYTINTDLISVFVSVKNKTLLETPCPENQLPSTENPLTENQLPCPENPSTESPMSENRTLSIKQYQSINKLKVLNKYSVCSEKNSVSEAKPTKNNQSPLEVAIQDFIQFRKKIKHPLTDRALQLIRAQLDKLTSSEEEKIKILEQSILYGWRGVFPLKQLENDKKSSAPPLVRGQMPEGSANTSKGTPDTSTLEQCKKLQLTEEEMRAAKERAAQVRAELSQKLKGLQSKNTVKTEGFTRLMEGVA